MIECPNRDCLRPLDAAIKRLSESGPVRVDNFKRDRKLHTLYIVRIEPFTIAWQKVGQMECKHYSGDDAYSELNTIPSDRFFEAFKRMYARWERGKVW